MAGLSFKALGSEVYTFFLIYIYLKTWNILHIQKGTENKGMATHSLL